MGEPIDDGRAVRLADGVELPMLGLGVWQIPDGPEAQRAVEWALEAGYRHIDTAQVYGNEASVGRAVAESSIPRDELFITTKFLPTRSDPEEEAKRSLERLGIDRLDLYLVHWPRGKPRRPWPGMERALERGLTRSIGVSNYGVGDLEQVLAGGGESPVVNQVQFNPFRFRRSLLEACARRAIVLEAYSPLTQARKLDHPVVLNVAEGCGHTPAQVVLRWAVQHGVPVIPKSSRRERIVENSRIFDFAIGEEEMRQLDALDQTGGTGQALKRVGWTAPERARSAAGQLARRLTG